MKTIKVYYAGKISKYDDWRDEIVGNRGGKEENPSIYTSDYHNRKFQYAGPYFIACDHGCYHGRNSHGVGANAERKSKYFDDCSTDCNENYSQIKALRKCKEWIDNSDVMFCYIDSTDCYGTLVEVGYAASKHIPIYLLINKDKLTSVEFRDLWFVRTIVNKCVECEDEDIHPIGWYNMDFMDWITTIL